VAAARAAAAERLAGTGLVANSQVPGRMLRERWAVPRSSLRLAERALERGALSVRGFDRVLRVAWTLADLAGRTVPGGDEVAEALGMRLQRAAA
jgi:magnesium chelatase family protein